MSYIAVVVILLVLVFLAQSEAILNGEDVGNVELISGQGYHITGQDEFPYMVHLVIYGVIKENASTMHCGGVIISENSVLTAGHCLSGYVKTPKVLIQAGIVHLTYEMKSAQMRKMKDFKLHEGFLDECIKTKIYTVFCLSDIAIVFLDAPFRFGPTVQKAILSQSENGPISGQKGYILGWGNKDKPMLQMTQMKTLSHLDCQGFFKKLVVQGDTFCLTAIEESRKTRPCRGDSGGPFIMDDGKVHGIISFQQFCRVNDVILPDSSKPTILTNVGDYYEWVQDMIKYNSPASSAFSKMA